jgi:hypothetical protein
MDPLEKLERKILGSMVYGVRHLILIIFCTAMPAILDITAAWVPASCLNVRISPENRLRT